MVNCALLKNCSLFRLKLSAWGNSKKITLTRPAVEKLIGPRESMLDDAAWEEQITTATARMRASGSLVICDEYFAIKEFMAETRGRLSSTYCNPSFIDDGLYAVKANVVPRVKAAVVAAQDELRGLVDAFIDVYPIARERARLALGDVFKDSDYPDADKVRKSFGITYRFVQLDVPEGLPPEIRAEEEKKLRETYDAAKQAIEAALWTEFQGFLEHVSERLEPGKDGKKKIFRDTLFDDLTVFIGACANRNAFNNTQLSAVVDQAREILAKVGGNPTEAAARMRDFDGLRTSTAEAIGKLKSAVDATIADLPTRALDLD